MPASSSDAKSSAAFHELHPDVQRWVYDQNWNTLRDIQEQAIEPILSGQRDVILAAPTASGKTEAAFLPICSAIANDRQASVETIYIGPLKALINDQFARLDTLCERLNIPVCRWHGDASDHLKKRLLGKPSGVLLITPESLEAFFILRGPAMPKLFQHVRYVVIDELHSFIGAERGRQLQSLIHRIELAIRRKVPRIALSATLGDMRLAAEFLRPKQAEDVLLIQSSDTSQEIRLQVRGYLRQLVQTGDQQESRETSDELAIATHLYSVLRGSNNLAFCNARQSVEKYADLLRRLCEQKHVPNEFFPHHGNLSKELREDVEKRLKEARSPVTAIATTTLELGIDLGSVKSIAQIGPAFSVASMRQRLGRSGRRGEPAILRSYIQEYEITKSTSPEDALRMNLFQTVAMVNLLVRKWYEPPSDRALHLSTFIQQILSLLAQHGGAKAKEIYTALCSSGPFASVTEAMFGETLRSLGKHDLLTQSHDGTLVVGFSGEALVNHYDFYTAFTTPQEYRIANDAKDLGTMPLEQPVLPGQYLIFAGRRWEVLSVDARQKLILVKAAAGGRLPMFVGTAGKIHGEIRKEMFRLYMADIVPEFLDAQAQAFLKEGRDNFHRFHLHEDFILAAGSDSLLFLWEGDEIVHTVAIELAARGMKTNVAWGVITAANIDADELKEHLKEIAGHGVRDAISLAASVPDKLKEKHDGFLSEELLNAEYASRSLDSEGAWRVVSSLMKEAGHA